MKLTKAIVSNLSLCSIVLLLSSFTPGLSLASDWYERGNGGDVLICQDSSQSLATYWMYDTVEAEHRYHLTPDVPFYNRRHDTYTPLQSTLVIAEELIRRLKPLDPKRAQKYYNWLTSFPRQFQFVKKHIPDIPDEGQGLISLPNCRLAQLIRQSSPRGRYDKLYTIVEPYWTALPADDQAVAIIHELILRELREQNIAVEYTDGVRYFNGIILTNSLQKMNAEQYLALLQKAGLHPYQ